MTLRDRGDNEMVQDQADYAETGSSMLPDSLKAELESIRQLWARSRKDGALTNVLLEDELESYVQVSLGDLGLALKIDESKQPIASTSDWRSLIEIAGRSVALLAALAKHRTLRV